MVDLHKPWGASQSDVPDLYEALRATHDCFSKKLDNLAAGTAMFMAYCNFCWQTRYPKKSGRAGTKRPTAAMMAKLAGHVWSFAKLFDRVTPAKVVA